MEQTTISARKQSSPASPEHTPDQEEYDGFDNLLSIVGFGRWQVTSLYMVILVAVILPIHMLGVSLLNAPMPFRCFQSANGTIASINQHLPISLHNYTEFDYYNNTCLTLEGLREELTGDNGNGSNGNKEIPVLPLGRYATGMRTCPYVEYDTSVFTSTIFSQFHLLCERSYLLPHYQIIYNIGNLVGNYLCGEIGDRWGRMTAVKLGSFLNIVGALLMMLVPSYPLMLLARALLGASTLGTLVPAWNLVLEATPARHRSVVGMLIGLPYSLAIIMFGVLGYFIRDWQTLFWVNAAPMLVLIPLTFIADESPRWLLQQGRVKDVTKIMEKAVVQNKVKLPSPLSSILSKILQTNGSSTRLEAKVRETGWLEMARATVHEARRYLGSPGMVIILIITPVIMFLHSFLYLGVMTNVNNFTTTIPSLYVALTGVMDGTAILLITPLTKWLGRRVLLGGGLLIGGVLFFVDLAVPPEINWLKWILVMTGFLLCAGAFQVLCVYSPELFPTLIRTRGFAFVSMISSIGFMCAPVITTSLTPATTWVASIVFGCSGIMASVLVPLLPETNGAPLPESLEDVNKRWKENEIRGCFQALGKIHSKSTYHLSQNKKSSIYIITKGIKNEAYENEKGV